MLMSRKVATEKKGRNEFKQVGEGVADRSLERAGHWEKVLR